MQKCNIPLNIFLLFDPVQGCETKDAKLVRMCLALMQRLVTNKVIDFKGARYITDTLWMLMEAGIEVIIFNNHNIRYYQTIFSGTPFPEFSFLICITGGKNPSNFDVDFNIKSRSSKRNTRPLFSHMLPLAFHS